jgi:hypothetical protein
LLLSVSSVCSATAGEALRFAEVFLYAVRSFAGAPLCLTSLYFEVLLWTLGGAISLTAGKGMLAPMVKDAELHH